MSITTAEKEWLKRLGTNKPVRDDKLQTEDKPRNYCCPVNMCKGLQSLIFLLYKPLLERELTAVR